MHHLVVHPPSHKTLGRGDRSPRFARGQTKVGGTAVVRNLPDGPIRGAFAKSFVLRRGRIEPRVLASLASSLGQPCQAEPVVAIVLEMIM